MENPASNPEQTKYEQMWGYNQYRKYAPGEHLASDFIRVACPSRGAKIIDFGAGTGRGALSLSRAGMDVTMLDFAKNCLDGSVRDAVDAGSLSFIHHDLLNEPPVKAEYGYCTDVMEHIQPDKVDDVLENILNSAEKVFFQISLQKDGCGVLIGEDLHLTVKPMEWWTRKFRDHKAFIYYTDKRGEDAVFYVSKIDTPSDVKLNIPSDILERNLKENIANGYTQVVPHAKSEGTLILLAGGPSLNTFKNQIRSRAKSGVPVICTNGTYKWCLDNNITPNGMIVVDARPHNAKFITEVVPGCKYFIASQCDPEMFAKVPRNQVLIWHSASPESNPIIEKLYGDTPWYPVTGGLTVTLRAITLLRMLGWPNQDIYGFDGCLVEDAHHAYEQTENDGHPVHTVTVGTRDFKCHPWMYSQAVDFQKQYAQMKGTLNLRVLGDGLIAHMLKSNNPEPKAAE